MTTDKIKRAGVGFTLVEILIALSIIMGLLLMISGIYQIPMERAKVDVLKANLRVIRRALQEFYNDNGRYPYNGQDEAGNIVTFLDNNTSELVNGVHNGLDTYESHRAKYLVGMPPDPTLTDPTPLWYLVPFDNDSDWDINIHDTDGNGEPSPLEPFVDEDPFGMYDQDGDGLVDEDPPDVRDVRSTNEDFADL